MTWREAIGLWQQGWKYRGSEKKSPLAFCIKTSHTNWPFASFLWLFYFAWHCCFIFLSSLQCLSLSGLAVSSIFLSLLLKNPIWFFLFQLLLIHIFHLGFWILIVLKFFGFVWRCDHGQFRPSWLLGRWKDVRSIHMNSMHVLVSFFFLCVVVFNWLRFWGVFELRIIGLIFICTIIWWRRTCTPLLRFSGGRLMSVVTILLVSTNCSHAWCP